MSYPEQGYSLSASGGVGRSQKGVLRPLLRASFEPFKDTSHRISIVT
jgi:hypothetical protein